ncbi:myo-inositol-1(or 4)-monophosphatase [Bacillus oleivorans]|uniref:Inositol-1-monophosphatase n=1 Tax=Bacillus oleivorans TaxID=1448271 RepID=A0A285CHS0_9BACI|nr:inositol monophosphatase family protein [Bacillus oleivorans]SNX67141.1 myo-inositol-1(or 4)-monophosphatase [Bacillus oleivorans]
MSENYKKELEIATEAALKAGDFLKNWAAPLEEEWKGKINPVTKADKTSEKLLIEKMKEAFPNDIIISEETNPLEEAEVINKRRWYLDPLDGTVNFMKGSPYWCIAIALVDSDNKTVCSVVYAPKMNNLFTAIRGKGAWLNGEKISVSQVEDLNRAVAASGFPYSFEDPEKSNLREWSNVTPEVLTVRSLGAAAMALCDVARGRLDFFWEQELERWDITAAALICKEAGAKVTDIYGQEFEGPETSVLAANPLLHNKVLEVLYKKA